MYYREQLVLVIIITINKKRLNHWRNKTIAVSIIITRSTVKVINNWMDAVRS